MCADLVNVMVRGDHGPSKKVHAILEDISPGGACLQLEMPVAVETAVSVLYPGGRFYGRVRYCDREQGRYYVGIQFDPGYQWSPRKFSPDHLLEFHLGPDQVE